MSEKKCCTTHAGVKLFVYLKCTALQGAEQVETPSGSATGTVLHCQFIQEGKG